MKKNNLIVSYPSDKNGCGFYRSMIPFSYLNCVGDFETPFLFGFNFDLAMLERAKWVRFQRQVTEAQKAIFFKYQELAKKNNYKTKFAYEIDDFAHAIEPQNILAYQFYTQKRKDNLVEIMKSCDLTTVSTDYLKNYYEKEHQVKNIRVVPNYLPKFLWGNCGQRDKYNKGKKLRILWAGSASHIGKGGDLEFMVPLIEKTINEFEWVFVGVAPFSIKDKVEFHKWSNFYNYPQALDSIDADIAIAPITDTKFNYGKSDLKVLEYTALGLPGIFSKTSGNGPYDLHKQILTVENNADDWYNAIKKLENDFEYRIELLENQNQILEKRWLEDNINLYEELFG